MKTIKIAPYGCLLHITTDFNEWKRTYERLSGNVTDSADVSGYTYDNLDGNYYVGIFRKDDFNVLVHELAHVCLMVAGRVQLGDIIKEQEQFCYLIGYLTQRALEVLPQLRSNNHVQARS